MGGVTSDSGVTAKGISRERCAANKAAGTITFVTSYDYSASANILGPIVADAEGYFKQMCLDIKIQPGFAPGNAAIVASGRAQVGSAGSMGEVINNNINGDAELVAVANYGKTAVEELLVPAGSRIETLSDLRGSTIGVKGDIPYSIQTMLAENGVERSSLKEVLLEGFDPVVHLATGIDSLPVYKSNEPGLLDAAGVKYRVFDPLEFGIPSSFGVQFTTKAFLADHPTAVQDFVRASFRGFQFGRDNPERAVQYAITLVNAANGTLTRAGESYRWRRESAIVLDSTPKGDPYGLIDPDRVKAEAEALTRAGVFTELPDYASMIAPSVAKDVWDGDRLIWPPG